MTQCLLPYLCLVSVPHMEGWFTVFWALLHFISFTLTPFLFCDSSTYIVPPSVTAPPTELTSTDIPVCCGGVQLNLANPDNPIDVRVLVDGILHPANQVVRDRDFLYIVGLQAGTEYLLRIALTNIFGTEWVNTTVRPLLGQLMLYTHLHPWHV